MAEATYKVGDILEFTEVVPRQFGLLAGPIRGLVVKISDPGYISYRLLLYGNPGCANNMTIGCAFEKDIIPAAKRVGHIDISLLMFEAKEQEEPDYAMFFTAATIAQAADLRNELDKIKKENEELKSQIACMEGRIKSLVQERDQLDADNRYLSAKVEHLAFSNNRKNGKIGSLQANLAEETLKRKQAEAELNEKAEELDGVYHSDIVCENNKLRDENKILNEIVNDFKSTCNNCEARSENERLKEENGKLAQKISCSDKLLAEAANRLYQGRAQLNMSAHN